MTYLHVIYKGELDVRPPSRESSDEEREDKEPWPDDHSSSRYVTCQPYLSQIHRMFKKQYLFLLTFFLDEVARKSAPTDHALYPKSNSCKFLQM